MEGAVLMSSGNLFQIIGATELKACKPKFVFARWEERSSELDERRFLIGI